MFSQNLGLSLDVTFLFLSLLAKCYFCCLIQVSIKMIACFKLSVISHNMCRNLSGSYGRAIWNDGWQDFSGALVSVFPQATVWPSFIEAVDDQTFVDRLMSTKKT